MYLVADLIWFASNENKRELICFRLNFKIFARHRFLYHAY